VPDVVLLLSGLLTAYAAVLLALLLARPDDVTLRSAARLLPDVVRLVRGLARDPDVPRAVRTGLLALLAYLVSPVDLVPDVVPVLGHVDDLVVAVVALRRAVRRAGADALRRHWPGDAAGLRAVSTIAGLALRPDRR
jgi:uncharacterized membrane protein YkvA (DUF1232 family)